MKKTVYDFKATTNNGKEVLLSYYREKVLLIVNTASNCGFTKQYSALQTIYEKYKDKGFEILAFPCNQFANQEPGSDAEISQFCKSNYGVTFPLFSKILVRGKNAHPLFQFLVNQKPGLLNAKTIRWNFTKFLINKSGIPVKRYTPSTQPQKIIPDIEKLLAG